MTSFGVGEPTTNGSIVTSSGVPFFSFADNVAANGQRTKSRSHLLARPVQPPGGIHVPDPAAHQRLDARVLNTHAYYVNASYFLTGERYHGDGTGTYTTISPIRPFMPARGQWGPGAWELATQFSQIFLTSHQLQDQLVAANGPNATRLSQLMVGVNWWPVKWARLSFDWVYDSTNQPIPFGGLTHPNNPHPSTVDNFNVFWTRVAFFF